MFLLALNALTLRTVKGDELCIDLEATDADYDINDDEVHEDTNDRVCAYQDGNEANKVCRNGVSRDWKRGDQACFDFDDKTLDKNKDFFVFTEGSDAVWIDLFTAWRRGTTGFSNEWDKQWGSNDADGYCLSMDRNDHLDWNHDDAAQYVSANDCFYALQLKTDGAVWGYRTYEPQQCRESKKMNCKQGCDKGWKHVDTSDHGCCASWTSCGGNKKTCSRDVDCRRRSEVDPTTTVEFLPHPLDEEHGHWTLLFFPDQDSSSPVDGQADKLADRLATASTESAEATDSDAEPVPAKSTESVKDEVKSAISMLEKLLEDIDAGAAN